GANGGVHTLAYAHTASSLDKVEPDTLQIMMIGNFQWPPEIGFDQMTDLAIDKAGGMIGISFGRVYRVDPTTAQTTVLAGTLAGTFNGLSYVPAAMLGLTGDDVLI